MRPSIRGRIWDCTWCSVRRLHARARLLEATGDRAASLGTYGTLIDLGDRCFRTNRWADFPCGAYIADALVRRAALARALDDTELMRRSLARFDTVWPAADPELPISERRAALP